MRGEEKRKINRYLHPPKRDGWSNTSHQDIVFPTCLFDRTQSTNRLLMNKDGHTLFKIWSVPVGLATV